MGLLSMFKRKEQPKPATPSEIVSAYGLLLENGAPAGGCVADVTELPYPKDKIRAAILSFLATGHAGEFREQLTGAYVLLANWQEGVGPRHRGMDLQGKSDLPVHEMAKYVLAEAEEMKRWTPLINAEQDRLLADLAKLSS